MPESKKPDDGKAQPTRVGCVLTLLSLVVTFSAAILIVRQRDLPRELAIYGPLLIGGTFHGVCTVLLQLAGIEVWSRPEKDGTGTSQDQGR